jgi:hypothetical protein
MTQIYYMAVALVIYFFPAILAHIQDTHNKDGITFLNLILGWTVVGWIICLFMACGCARTPEQHKSLPTRDCAEQLRDLAAMLEKGVLTPKEFQKEKFKIIARDPDSPDTADTNAPEDKTVYKRQSNPWR